MQFIIDPSKGPFRLGVFRQAKSEKQKSADGKTRFSAFFSALFRKKKFEKRQTFYFLLAESEKQKIWAANQKIEFDAFHFSAFRLAKNV